MLWVTSTIQFGKLDGKLVVQPLDLSNSLNVKGKMQSFPAAGPLILEY